ncbi:MAG: flagellar hook-associated protein FlgL [Candidatus Caldatribacteriaceae bacterium]
MRVTQQMLTNRVMGNLNSIMSKLLKTQDMLSSGKSLRYPSDDPIRFNRILNLHTLLNKIGQHYSNVEGAIDWLNLLDESLGQVGNTLQEIRTLAIQGANGTLAAEDRSILAERIEEALAELVTIANTTSGDKYLFSGTQTLTVPFVLSGDTIVYQGDSATVARAINNDTVMEISFPGDQVFYHGFEVWSSNSITLNVGDRFIINGVEIEIDASISNVQDLVNKINNDPVLRSSAYAFFDGSRLFLRSRSDSVLVLADISGTPLQNWGILDAGGNIAPGNSREAGGMFKVIQDLIVHLRTGDTESISGEDIADLDVIIDETLKIRSRVGARTKRLENTLSRFDDFTLNFKKLLSKDEDIDLAEVIMQLKEWQSVYETALAAGSQVIQPTLLDFLR